MDKKHKSELVLAREGKIGKLSIIGDVGWDWFGKSYKAFKKELDDLGKLDLIEVEINSPGGVVTDGVAIFNALSQHDAVVHTYISGQAASIASVIAMAGDKVFMPDNAMFFVHKPLNWLVGNADDMRKMADDLDKFETTLVNSYKKHFKGDEEEIKSLMQAETWMTADEVEEKFNNVVVMKTGEQKVAAHSEPLAILGEIQVPQETLLDKAVNALRTRVTENKQEVDMPMTPEEKAELVQEVTASVVAALKPAEEPKKEEPKALEIAFEGDMDKPEDVLAHAEKLKKAQIRAAVNWNDLESVKAYHKAIAPEAKAQPTTNAAPVTAKAGGEQEKFTAEDKAKAVEAMTKVINKK